MSYRYAAFAALFILLVTGSVAEATTFTVSNTNASGAGSFDQAFLNANADNTATPSSPHIILFTVTGTIAPAENQILTNHI